MLLVRTYISPSPIQGNGAFAAERIVRGTLIWQLNPIFDIFLRESDLKVLPPHMQEFIARYGYPHLELPGVVIVDSDNGRFMNHSETPNTDFTVFAQGYAIGDIAEGDELTYNYAEFDPTFKGFNDKNVPRTAATSAWLRRRERQPSAHKPFLALPADACQDGSRSP